jgi:hypothetical protein
MKRLLSVGAITLALTFSAYAEAPDHVAFMPDFYKCFDLLRFESLHADPKDDSVLINVNDKNQMELLHRYFQVTSWLRGYFTAMNTARAFNGLTPDATNHTTQKEWMPWIFSYCRSHPTDTIEDVTHELVKAFSGSSNKDSK